MEYRNLFFTLTVSDKTLLAFISLLICGYPIGYFLFLKGVTPTDYQVEVTDHIRPFVFTNPSTKPTTSLRHIRNVLMKRIHNLQNPADCSTARILVCDLRHRGCGYGSLLGHVTVCLIAAYATNRTLVLEKTGWNYAPDDGWEVVFQPVSKSCASVNISDAVLWMGLPMHNKKTILKMPHYLALFPPRRRLTYNFIPNAVPSDVAEALQGFNVDPLAWWCGILVDYLTRPNKMLRDYIASRNKILKFQHPIVGVHIRRGGKLATEAAFHDLVEYMHHAEKWFLENGKPLTGKNRYIYLASDTKSLLNKAKSQYPNYTFISDIPYQSKLRGNKYTVQSLLTILADIYFLTRTDHVVCTLSSNVCSVIYETRHAIDTSGALNFVTSLDMAYFKYPANREFVATQDHINRTTNETTFLAGDALWMDVRMTFRKQHGDGMVWGGNNRTKAQGRIPLNKTRLVVNTVQMPTFGLDFH